MSIVIFQYLADSQGDTFEKPKIKIEVELMNYVCFKSQTFGFSCQFLFQAKINHSVTNMGLNHSFSFHTNTSLVCENVSMCHHKPDDYWPGTRKHWNSLHRNITNKRRFLFWPSFTYSIAVWVIHVEIWSFFPFSRWIWFEFRY